MRKIAIILATIALISGCATNTKYAHLQKSLAEFTEDKDANIGIAIIIDGKDTIAVNGNKEFPMLSVYKFPIALALADDYCSTNRTFDYTIPILPEDLHPDTYSPMTEKILASNQLTSDTLKLSTRELLRYMLQQSDNNASDIVLKSIGGANKVNFKDINVRNTEDEMHKDNSLCYANSATPLGMALLMDQFDIGRKDSLSNEIKQLMETCATGTNRLAKPLTSINAVLGHKTGTGFMLPDGRLMAINDAGYVHLPNGHRYSIAVFIENSGYDMIQSEALIAEISQIVFSNIRKTIIACLT